MITTAFVAAIATAALLGINNPSIFRGSDSPWSTLFEAVIDYVAILAAVLFAQRSAAE